MARRLHPAADDKRHGLPAAGDIFADDAIAVALNIDPRANGIAVGPHMGQRAPCRHIQGMDLGGSGQTAVAGKKGQAGVDPLKIDLLRQGSCAFHLRGGYAERGRRRADKRIRSGLASGEHGDRRAGKDNSGNGSKHENLSRYLCPAF
jgi:hypothetical protein